MPAVIVYTCTQGGSQATVALQTTRYPTCPNGNGQWQAITVPEDFDVSNLTMAELTAAWSAGFTVMASGLVVVLAGRALLKAFK